MDEMEAIKVTFFLECEELLADLENGLLTMRAGDADNETVNAVFRAVHSIKGGAGAFGFESLVRFSHVFETLMDKVRSGHMAQSADLAEALLRAADVLADLVSAARNGVSGEDERSVAIAAELEEITGRDMPASEADVIAAVEA